VRGVREISQVPENPEEPEPEISECTDGTSVNSCSAIQPRYCNSEKVLVDNCSFCGVCEVSQGIEVLECGNLTQANSDYYLSSNLPASSTCLSIQANNIILDCKGYSITGNTGSYGVSIINYNSATIKNCNFISFETAIYVLNSESNNITSNSIQFSSLSNLVGIWLENSKNNIIQYNDMRTLSNNDYGSGIRLEKDDSGNVIQYNNMSGVNQGFVLNNFVGWGITNNQINNNRICSADAWDFNCVNPTDEILNNICSGGINGCGTANLICPTSC
jgi:hypothetical protein